MPHTERTCRIGPHNILVTGRNFRNYLHWNGPVPDCAVTFETVAIYVAQVQARRMHGRSGTAYLSFADAPEDGLSSPRVRQFRVGRGEDGHSGFNYVLGITEADLAAVRAVLAADQ